MNQKKAKYLRKLIPVWRQAVYTNIRGTIHLEAKCGRAIYQKAKQIEKEG